MAEAAQQQRRNDELLTQLSTSSELLTGLTGQARLSAADGDVAKQVAAQRVAERAAARPGARAQARTVAVRAQLRNAQTCAAGALLALSQVHSGPDLESGADEAADTLKAVLPACRSGLE